MTELVVAAMTGLSVWLVLRAMIPARPGFAAQTRVLDAPDIKTRTNSLVRVAARLGSLMPSGMDTLKIALTGAGLGSMEPQQFRGIQLMVAGCGFLLGLKTGMFAILASPLAAFAGYRLPSLILAAKLQRRREEVAQALPDAVDLLAVCTQAGLNLSLSLKRVGDSASGLLGFELRRMLQEIELGIPRATALGNLATRVQLDEVNALVSTLSSADRFGTQVSASLSNFATEVRQSRRRAAEEQARRAPVKILFPLVFLILPAFIVLTVAPLILGAFNSLGF